MENTFQSLVPAPQAFELSSKLAHLQEALGEAFRQLQACQLDLAGGEGHGASFLSHGPCRTARVSGLASTGYEKQVRADQRDLLLRQGGPLSG